MKKAFKKLILVVLVMTLTLFTFACGEKPCTHKDDDGDGVIGNTDMLYNDYKDGGHIIKGKGTLLNLNPILPPEYIKILGNSGGYVYTMPDTSGLGVESGGYHGVAENMGGFFGSTKFYYTDIQTGEIKHFLGTGATDASDSPFVFVK
ncbi:MAG: hypothetical protein J6V09_07235 [Clostridia bacterium]|nr:hypothetical protein [Clostridia bacterium]